MQLIWDIDKQYGFVNIEPRQYGLDYFKKYVDYANTPMGEKLTQARIDFVNRTHKGELLDVGVGSGHFVMHREKTFGFDINETAVKLLQSLGLYEDIHDPFEAYSFFDSFEHIEDPSPLLREMGKGTLIFLSIPMFRDVQHALNSKHFRRDEHYWYFTPQGLIRYMLDHGFVCVDVDNFEIRTGREDIMSFAFRKS